MPHIEIVSALMLSATLGKWWPLNRPFSREGRPLRVALANAGRVTQALIIKKNLTSIFVTFWNLALN